MGVEMRYDEIAHKSTRLYNKNSKTSKNKPLARLTICVNFTNILRGAFVYESCTLSYFVLEIWLWGHSNNT